MLLAGEREGLNIRHHAGGSTSLRGEHVQVNDGKARPPEAASHYSPHRGPSVRSHIVRELHTQSEREAGKGGGDVQLCSKPGCLLAIWLVFAFVCTTGIL